MNLVSKILITGGLVTALSYAGINKSLTIASVGCPMLNVAHTHSQQTSLNDCVTVWASNQSWFSWVSGKSRSAQFHFVDFVELVYRMHKVHKEL